MSKPALLGGPKAVTEPFPSWPIWDDEDKRAVLGVLESGKWWMYGYGEQELGGEAGGQRPRSQVEQFEEEFAALHRVLHGIAVAAPMAPLSRNTARHPNASITGAIRSGAAARPRLDEEM